MKKPSLAMFILLVMGGGIAIGVVTAPGDWYANLEKPFFNPPNWIFAPVWTVLYMVISYVGWRVCDIEKNNPLMRLWGLQLCLNFIWSPIFFGAQNPRLAFFVIGFLLVVILLFIWSAWRNERISAMLFIPYLAWVGFATTLNGAIYILNPTV